MQLLIVDDNQAMRELITKVVGELADCDECSDGAQALEAYRAQHPDWVLMDIEMKVMDGLTAARQITAAFPEAKIIIVTRHDDEKLRELAQQAGACAYVVKENLLKLRELLNHPGPLAQKANESH